MIVSRQSDDFEPLTWARGVPIYVTTLLVALHVGALFTGWTASALGHHAWIAQFAFRSADVLHAGALWQWVSYVFVQPLGNPLFFAIEMFLLFAFGREVERYIGRRHFMALYAILVLAPPVLLTALGLLFGTGLNGSGQVHFAIFVAFTALYPGVEFFFRIQARWLAAGLFGLYALFYVAMHQWSHLGALAGDTAAALLFIAWLRGTITFPRFSFPRRAPSRSKSGQKEPPAKRDPMETIDPLLDKIAREGLASLTSAERSALEKARQELLGRR